MRLLRLWPRSHQAGLGSARKKGPPRPREPPAIGDGHGAQVLPDGVLNFPEAPETPCNSPRCR
eukprot:3663144-Pyramimonas_sp.AAC.1